MTPVGSPLPLETLPQVLRWRAASTPTGIAQRHKERGIWKRYDWQAVETQVRRAALGLRTLDVRAGDVVALIGENSPQLFWAELSAQALGAATVCVYPDATAEELQFVLEDSGAVSLFAEDQEQVDKALAVLERAPRLRHIVYWKGRGLWNYAESRLLGFGSLQARVADDDAAKEAYATLLSQRSAREVALISYTSGTTGRPKGVVWSQASLLSNARRLVAALPFRPGFQYLSYISPAWGTEQVFGFACGLLAPMVINFAEKPEDVLANIRELAVEALAFSPRQWENLAASVRARMLAAGPVRRKLVDWGLAVGHAVHVERLEGRPVSPFMRALLPLAEALVLRPLRDKLGLTRVKLALCGGSSMAPDLFRFFHAMGVPLRNVYGISEFGLCAVHQGERYDLETVGRWLPDDPTWPATQWRIDDAGELQLKGGAGFSGYHNMPNETRARWQGDWFRTGDAVAVAANGEVVFLDRVEDLRHLQSGHAYPPQYLETRLRLSPFIKDVLILGDRQHARVVALIGIAFDVVAQWAENRRLAFSTYADLSQSGEVAELVREEIQRANRLLPPESRIARFANFPKELDPDEGELTRTRKLRRDAIERRYGALIDALHAGRKTADVELSVGYEDGRRGVFRATVRLLDVQPLQAAAA